MKQSTADNYEFMIAATRIQFLFDHAPDIIEVINELTDKKAAHRDSWPAYAFIPVDVAAQSFYDLLSDDDKTLLEDGDDQFEDAVSTIPLYAAWMGNRRKVVVKHALIAEAEKTDATLYLDHEPLRELLKSPVYFEFEGGMFGNEEIYGFFAWLDYTAMTESTTVSFVMSYATGTAYASLPWQSGTLTELSEENYRIADGYTGECHTSDTVREYAEMMQPFFSVLVKVLEERRS